MRTSSKTILSLAVAAVVSMIIGCRSLKIEKRDPVIRQTSSNTWVVVEGGWEAKYHAFGMWTQFGELSVSLHTNGLKTITLKDLNTDVSTNHVAIIAATGGTAADIAKAITEALK